MESANVGKKGKFWVISIPAIIVVLIVTATVAFIISGNATGDKVLTQDLVESQGDATAARFDINTGTGSLMIDRLAASEQLLASGTIQYLEHQGRPSRLPAT